MSEQSEQSEICIGDWIHVVLPWQVGNQVSTICCPALVLQVLATEQVSMSDGLPAQEPVLVEIHAPDGVKVPQPVSRDELGKRPGTWHRIHAPNRVVRPVNGGRLLQG